MRLSGRVALVTGAGGGIGEAIARQLCVEGASVAILDLNADDVERVAGDLGRGRGYVGNVTDDDSVVGILAEVGADLGGLDILVNNAGITRDGRIAELAAADWHAVLDVNLYGTWNCSRAALPFLLERGPSGRIINIASTSALGAYGQTNYAASKAGVLGLTRSLALEVARAGVTVNAIAPGLIDTRLSRAIPPHVFERSVGRIPMRRPGQPSEVAHVAAFLASDAASYVTGQVLYVCGGYSVGAGHP